MFWSIISPTYSLESHISNYLWVRFVKIEMCFTLFDNGPRICFVWGNHDEVISPFTTYHWYCNKSDTTGNTSGAGQFYPSRLRVPELTHCDWCGVCCLIFNVLCSVCRSLFVLLSLFFSHYVACPSSIDGFWLSVWYLQTLLDKHHTTHSCQVLTVYEDPCCLITHVGWKKY